MGCFGPKDTPQTLQKVVSLEDEVEKLKQQANADAASNAKIVADLKQQLANATAKLTAIEHEKGAIATKLDSKVKAAEESSQVIASLDAQVAQLNVQLGTTKAALEACQAELEESKRMAQEESEAHLALVAKLQQEQQAAATKKESPAKSRSAKLVSTLSGRVMDPSASSQPTTDEEAFSQKTKRKSSMGKK